jgi:hypothetical protein
MIATITERGPCWHQAERGHAVWYLPVLCPTSRPSTRFTLPVSPTRPLPPTRHSPPRTAGVLKAWLEPLPDGTLPNSKVRSTVLRLLGQLPVDCAQEDRKEQLKRSGLGRVIMFLYKVPGACRPLLDG